MRKKWVGTALAAALGLLGGRAWAASQYDSLTVTIKPNAYYAVSIDTDDASLDLGTVELAASTWTLKPATVTIESSYAGTSLKLMGAIACAGTAWQFSNSSSTIEAGKLAAWAVFTDTSVAAAPGQTSGYFDGNERGDNSDMISTDNRSVGAMGGAETAFLAGPGDAGYKTMYGLPNNLTDLAASRAHLWLRFRLPGATTDNYAQKVTIRLQAGIPGA